jgi:tetratricopeptide (TPR) repeat protein
MSSEKENQKEEIEKLLEKIKDIKKGEFDLSLEEDLSVAIMNLISIEEHFFFTGAKTEKDNYYDLLSKTREIRKELMKKIIKDYEGEVWCLSKHLLSASMRLFEVGEKYLSQNKKEEAKDLFNKAYELYSLFWGINLNLINIGEVKKIEDNQINKEDKDSKDILSKLKEVLNKIIDCCKE